MEKLLPPFMGWFSLMLEVSRPVDVPVPESPCLPAESLTDALLQRHANSSKSDISSIYNRTESNPNFKEIKRLKKEILVN